MSTTEPTPEPDSPDMPDEPDYFPDEGAGPEEPDEVLNDPENQAAAEAIRESTLVEGEDEAG